VIQIPDLSGVPDVRGGSIENACRRASEVPKSRHDDSDAHRDVMRLVERRLRRGEFGTDDFDAFAAYRDGKYNIRHRPIDEGREHVLQTIGEGIEAIQRRDGSTLEAAVRAYLGKIPIQNRIIENGIERVITSNDDPDDEIFSYLFNMMKRQRYNSGAKTPTLPGTTMHGRRVD
jgi:hypothetical protein